MTTDAPGFQIGFHASAHVPVDLGTSESWENSFMFLNRLLNAQVEPHWSYHVLCP